MRPCCQKSRCRANNVTFFGLIGGLILIVLGQVYIDLDYNGFKLGSISTSIGTFLATILVMQFLYDTYVREEYFNEISLSIINSTNVLNSGICDFYGNSKDIDYSDLISTSNEVEVVLNSSSRLIKDYIQEWELRGQSQSKVTTFYYVKKSGNAATYLVQTGYDKANLITSIDESLRLINKHIGKENCDVIEHDLILSYNVFKFDTRLFIVLNTNGKDKARVPVMEVKYNSPLWNFVIKDLEVLKNEQ